MEYIRITFDHPVKASCRFWPLSEQSFTGHGQVLATDDDHQLSVPVGNLGVGKWELSLEWEYEERNYQHTQEFKVETGPDLFKALMYANACLYHSRHPLHDMNR